MKKLLLSFVIVVFGFIGANAQMEVGAFAGYPVSGNDGIGVNVGANASYYYYIIDGKLGIGGTAGVDHFFGKDFDFGGDTYEGDGATFIPIAASAKFNFTDKFFAGLDLGYAIAISKDTNGGLYVRPRVGMSLPMVDVYLFYKGINSVYGDGYWGDYYDYTDWDDNLYLGTLGVGAAFRF